MKRQVLAISAGVICAAVIAASAHADIVNRIHSRCWDDTLRLSHGGWVSYRHIAEDNCKRAAIAYPRNVMWVESQNY